MKGEESEEGQVIDLKMLLVALIRERKSLKAKRNAIKTQFSLSLCATLSFVSLEKKEIGRPRERERKE